MKWTTSKNPKKKKNIRQNEICRGKPRHEGVEKVDTLRQNQDFDEVTVCINSTFHRHKNALKRAVFLVGSEFRLRVPFGKPHTARDAGSHLWLTFAEQMC